MRALGLSLLAIADVGLGIFLNHTENKLILFVIMEIILIMMTALFLVRTLWSLLRHWRS
ncbi:MAG: hypothetical protein OWR62_13925 [Sulfobacillus thermotolerans]|nr:hypothetical protein [Sulfobacillus thermotolerans]